MLIELEKDNLNEIVKENKIVFVQYSAGWCGNCRVMKPKFKRHSNSLEEREDISFVLVDAEKFEESRQLASVDNLPTFAAFKDGELFQQIQTNKADKLKDFIDEITNN